MDIWSREGKMVLLASGLVDCEERVYLDSSVYLHTLGKEVCIQRDKESKAMYINSTA